MMRVASGQGVARDGLRDGLHRRVLGAGTEFLFVLELDHETGAVVVVGKDLAFVAHHQTSAAGGSRFY